MNKLAPMILTLASVLLALSGCSAPEPTDKTYHGELTDSDSRVPDDDSPYDEYTFEAGEGWTVTVDLSSSAFDPYLWLIGPNGESLIQDDDSGDGTNSRATYTTTESGTYIVRANSYDEKGRGAYTLHIQAHPAD